MNRRWILAGWMLLSVLALAACGETPAQPAPVVAAPTNAPVAPTSGAVPATAPAATKPAAPVAATAAPTKPAAVKGALTCPPTVPLAANVPAAARVNGVGIALDYYNRQADQAQAAMVQNGGLDPKTQAGQDTIKSLKAQVLDQLINDQVIAQQSDREGIKVTDDDLNTRLAQMIQDAGSVDKLNEYMAKNQLTLGDLCGQVRTQLLGEAMMNKVTSAFPTTAEQVHVRHILVSTAALATQIRDRARKGEDFAALAKQYSMDETNKNNGGDLGWLPKGVLDPRLDAVIFDIPLNQISDVITGQYGYHVVQVLEKDKARALPPEMLQNARQQAFLKWLQAVRETMKVERLVQ